jgi:hypothetical protein
VPALIKFSSASGIASEVGPFDELRFTSDTLYGQPGHQVLARDVNHRWVTSAGVFLRIDVAHRVTIYAETLGEKSSNHGPFTHFSSGDGIAYVDREVFAFADHVNKQWYVIKEDRRWAVMVAVIAPTN